MGIKYVIYQILNSADSVNIYKTRNGSVSMYPQIFVKLHDIHGVKVEHDTKTEAIQELLINKHKLPVPDEYTSEIIFTIIEEFHTNKLTKGSDTVKIK